MHPLPQQQPSRRSVLRAASASIAALAIVSAASSHAVATDRPVEPPQGKPDGGPHLPGPPDHRSIVGLL
jgi:hypothetical protein